MYKKLINLVTWSVSAVLIIFTARRWLFLIFALKPNRTAVKLPLDLPAVLLLVPVRNEAETLPDLFPTLAQLDYPSNKLTVVFINDGSTDTSDAVLRQQTTRYENWHTLSLVENRGKADALNLALSRFYQGDIIAVYDADERPDPSALKYLVAPFAEAQIGAVSGQRVVSNSLVSPAASYTAFENLVHQLVTMRAKDRLDLAPALLGSNCAYRRTALVQAGNFKPGALLEDSDLTVKLAIAGWQTRFVPQAVSYHHVPKSIGGYWKQHTRWARGFADVAGDQTRSLLNRQTLSLFLRLELLIFSLGYLDRVALLAGGALALVGHRLVRWAVVTTLLTPLLQVLAALQIARAPVALWWRIVWLPIFLGLDIAMAIVGLWGKLINVPHLWEDRRTRQ